MLPCHRRRRLPRIVKYRNWARDVVLSCAKPLNKQEQQRRRGTRNCVVQRNRVHEMHLYDLDVSYSLFSRGLEIFPLPVRIRTRIWKVHADLAWHILTFQTRAKAWVYGNFETMLNKPVAHPNLSFITNQSWPTLFPGSVEFIWRMWAYWKTIGIKQTDSELSSTHLCAILRWGKKTIVASPSYLALVVRCANLCAILCWGK